MQTEIENIENVDRTMEREQLESQYYASAGRARKLSHDAEARIPNALNRTESEQQNFADNARNAAPNQSKVKLSTLTIPNFDGSYEDWAYFRDIF